MFIALITATLAMSATDGVCTAQNCAVQSTGNPIYSFSGPDNSQVVNGRVFNGRPIIGGLEVGARSDAAHAAAGFGAFGEEGTRVQAEVPGIVRYNPVSTVEFSPWTSVPEQQTSPYSDAYTRARVKMAHHAEEARQQWLKDNNYVGGVRTFVNDLNVYAPVQPQTARPEPRGVIEVAPSPEQPAFKARMHVNIQPDQIHTPRFAAVSSVPAVQPKAEAKAEAKVEAKPEIKAEAKVETKIAQK